MTATQGMPPMAPLPLHELDPNQASGRSTRASSSSALTKDSFKASSIHGDAAAASVGGGVRSMLRTDTELGDVGLIFQPQPKLGRSPALRPGMTAAPGALSRASSRISRASGRTPSLRSKASNYSLQSTASHTRPPGAWPEPVPRPPLPGSSFSNDAKFYSQISRPKTAEDASRALSYTIRERLEREGSDGPSRSGRHVHHQPVSSLSTFRSTTSMRSNNSNNSRTTHLPRPSQFFCRSPPRGPPPGMNRHMRAPSPSYSDSASVSYHRPAMRSYHTSTTEFNGSFDAHASGYHEQLPAVTRPIPLRPSQLANLMVRSEVSQDDQAAKFLHRPVNSARIELQRSKAALQRDRAQLLHDMQAHQQQVLEQTEATAFAPLHSQSVTFQEQSLVAGKKAQLESQPFVPAAVENSLRVNDKYRPSGAYDSPNNAVGADAVSSPGLAQSYRAIVGEPFSSVQQMARQFETRQVQTVQPAQYQPRPTVASRLYRLQPSPALSKSTVASSEPLSKNPLADDGTGLRTNPTATSRSCSAGPTSLHEHHNHAHGLRQSTSANDINYQPIFNRTSSQALSFELPRSGFNQESSAQNFNKPNDQPPESPSAYGTETQTMSASDSLQAESPESEAGTVKDFEEAKDESGEMALDEEHLSGSPGPTRSMSIASNDSLDGATDVPGIEENERLPNDGSANQSEQPLPADLHSEFVEHGSSSGTSVAHGDADPYYQFSSSAGNDDDPESGRPSVGTSILNDDGAGNSSDQRNSFFGFSSLDPPKFSARPFSLDESTSASNMRFSIGSVLSADAKSRHRSDNPYGLQNVTEESGENSTTNVRRLRFPAMRAAKGVTFRNGGGGMSKQKLAAGNPREIPKPLSYLAGAPGVDEFELPPLKYSNMDLTAQLNTKLTENSRQNLKLSKLGIDEATKAPESCRPRAATTPEDGAVRYQSFFVSHDNEEAVEDDTDEPMTPPAQAEDVPAARKRRTESMVTPDVLVALRHLSIPRSEDLLTRYSRAMKKLSIDHSPASGSVASDDGLSINGEGICKTIAMVHDLDSSATAKRLSQDTLLDIGCESVLSGNVMVEDEHGVKKIVRRRDLNKKLPPTPHDDGNESCPSLAESSQDAPAIKPVNRVTSDYSLHANEEGPGEDTVTGAKPAKVSSGQKEKAGLKRASAGRARAQTAPHVPRSPRIGSGLMDVVPEGDARASQASASYAGSQQSNRLSRSSPNLKRDLADEIARTMSPGLHGPAVPIGSMLDGKFLHPETRAVVDPGDRYPRGSTSLTSPSAFEDLDGRSVFSDVSSEANTLARQHRRSVLKRLSKASRFRASQVPPQTSGLFLPVGIAATQSEPPERTSSWDNDGAVFDEPLPRTRSASNLNVMFAEIPPAGMSKTEFRVKKAILKIQHFFQHASDLLRRRGRRAASPAVPVAAVATG